MPEVARFVYFDPNCDGHRREYLTFFLEVCARVGVKLCAYVPAALWKETCALAQGGIGLAEHTCDIEISIDSFKQKCSALADLFAAESGRQRTLLFFPMIDEYLLPMLYVRVRKGRFGTPWSGTIFRNSFDYLRDEISKPKLFLKSVLRRIVLPAVVRTGAVELFTLNPEWKKQLSVPVTWLPDTLSSLDRMAVVARDRDGWPVPRSADGDDRVHLLAFGSMVARKGILELVTASAALRNEELCRIELRILGKFTADYRMQVEAWLPNLRQRGAIIEIIDDYVSEPDLYAALCRCDYVLAPYVHHIGSSGVVGLAAQFGRPVLGQNTYQVGDEIRRWELGLAVDCRSQRALVAALRQLLSGKVAVTDKMRSYCERKTPLNATATIERFLQRRFGLHDELATPSA